MYMYVCMYMYLAGHGIFTHVHVQCMYDHSVFQFSSLDGVCVRCDL